MKNNPFLWLLSTAHLLILSSQDCCVWSPLQQWEDKAGSVFMSGWESESGAVSQANRDAGLQLIVRQDNCSIQSTEGKIIWIYLKACGYNLKGNGTKAVYYLVYDQIWCRNIDDLINRGKNNCLYLWQFLSPIKPHEEKAPFIWFVFCLCSSCCIHCLQLPPAVVQSCPESRPLCTK